MREYPDLPMNSYICSVLYNGICRISVPIFFMISGALLLEQPTDLKKNTKRLISMTLKTIAWGLVFIVWDYFYLGEIYSFKGLFSTPVRVHFWYLYVMVGIYITLPLWQKLVSGDSKKLMKYFSIAFIILLAINFVLDIFRLRVTYEVPLLGNAVYACYFIMGYVIRHYIDEIRIKKWICYTVLIVCVASTDLLTLLASKRAGSHIEIYSDFRTVFIALTSMIVFYLFMKAKEFRHRKWIAVVSKHSFNIYMMHVFFLDIVKEAFDISRINAWYGFPFFFVILISCSLIFSWLFEKLKPNGQSVL